MNPQQECDLEQVAHKLGMSYGRLRCNKRLFASACEALNITPETAEMETEIPPVLIPPPVVYEPGSGDPPVIREYRRKIINQHNTQVIFGVLRLFIAILVCGCCWLMLGRFISKRTKI